MKLLTANYKLQTTNPFYFLQAHSVFTDAQLPFDNVAIVITVFFGVGEGFYSFGRE